MGRADRQGTGMEDLMRVAETQKFSVLEQNDDRLVLSSRPFLVRTITIVALSPLLLIPLAFLIPHLSGDARPGAGGADFALFLAPILAGFAVVATLFVIITQNYKLYEFDVRGDLVRYAQRKLPSRAPVKREFRLSELGDLQAQRGVVRTSRNGFIHTYFIFATGPRGLFVLPMRDQPDRSDDVLKWIAAARRRAAKIASE